MIVNILVYLDLGSFSFSLMMNPQEVVQRQELEAPQGEIREV